MTSDPNPWDILAFRRKLKKFEAYDLKDSIKLLKKVKEMNLSTKMLKATEFTRTLKWIIIKTDDASEEKLKLFNHLCRYLFKQWKNQIIRDT